jgi:hypothetical protein
MNDTPPNLPGTRLDAWYDGSAICVIAVSGSPGDPLDLGDDEVIDFIAKLQGCLAESQGLLTTDGGPPHQPQGTAQADDGAATLRHLAASRFHLPAHLPAQADQATDTALTHHLHRREFDLALKAAELLGTTLHAPTHFWHELALAAASMGLPQTAARYASGHLSSPRTGAI